MRRSFLCNTTSKQKKNVEVIELDNFSIGFIIIFKGRRGTEGNYSVQRNIYIHGNILWKKNTNFSDTENSPGMPKEDNVLGMKF